VWVFWGAHIVEVKGTLRCDEPLTSEMTGTECAYYSAAVVREYLEEDRDDNDVTRDRCRETLSSNVQSVPFRVEDAMGVVAVDPEGAEVDAKSVMDRFERFTGQEGPSVSLGGVTLRLGERERTLGYRYQESILPVDAPVYVLGAVREGGAIGAPPPGTEGARFIISHRSEEALTKSIGGDARVLALVSAGLGAFGAIFIAVAVAAAAGVF